MKAYNEDQQVEIIKNIWDKYGNAIMSIVVFAILSVAGMQYWQKHEARQAEGASILYESMVNAVNTKDYETAQQQADTLIKQYSRSIYASYANLILAKLAIDNNKYDDAEGYFNWVKSKSPSLVLKELANVRYARLLVSRGKVQDALDVVDRNRFKVYLPIADEIKGDAELALGHREAAKNAYEKSLKESTLPRPFLNMKVARLAKLSNAEVS